MTFTSPSFTLIYTQTFNHHADFELDISDERDQSDQEKSEFNKVQILPSSLKVPQGIEGQKLQKQPFSSKNLLNTDQKDKFQIDHMDGLKVRKPSHANMLSINPNKFDMQSMKGGPLSTRSKGPSVNEILARRKESMQQKATGQRKRGGPERTVSRARDGLLSMKRLGEADIPEIRQGHQPGQKKQSDQRAKSRNRKSTHHLHVTRDDDVLSSHSSKRNYGSPTLNPLDARNQYDEQESHFTTEKRGRPHKNSVKVPPSPSVQIPEFNDNRSSGVPTLKGVHVGQNRRKLQDLLKQSPRRTPLDRSISVGSLQAVEETKREGIHKNDLMRPTVLIETTRSKNNTHLNTKSQQITQQTNQVDDPKHSGQTNFMSGLFNPEGLINQIGNIVNNLQQQQVQSEAAKEQIPETPSGVSENTMNLPFGQLAQDPLNNRRSSVASSQKRKKRQKKISQSASAQQMFEAQKNSETPKHHIEPVDAGAYAVQNRPSEQIASFLNQFAPDIEVEEELEPSIEEQVILRLNRLIERIQMSTDSEECYFLDQLVVIKDRFNFVEKAKITQYFEKLVNVVNEDQNTLTYQYYDQIKTIFDLLKDMTPDAKLSIITAPKKQSELKQIENTRQQDDKTSSVESIGKLSDEGLLDHSIVHNSESTYIRQESASIPGRYLSHLEPQLDSQLLIDNPPPSDAPPGNIYLEEQVIATAQDLEKDKIIEQLEREKAQLNLKIQEEQKLREDMMQKMIEEQQLKREQEIREAQRQKIILEEQLREEQRQREQDEMHQRMMKEEQERQEKLRLEQEAELSLRQQQLREEQQKFLEEQKWSQFEHICQKVSDQFKEVSKSIAKLEKRGFGEQARASLDKELQQLEPKVLYSKFKGQSIPDDKMLNFVTSEYKRVYNEKNERATQRISERISGHKEEKQKRKTHEKRTYDSNEANLEETKRQTPQYTDTPQGVEELVSKRENQPKESHRSLEEQSLGQLAELEFEPDGLGLGQGRTPQAASRTNEKGRLTEKKPKEQPAGEKKKFIFGKRRDQNQPVQRLTGASQLIQQIQVEDGKSKRKRK